MYNKVILVGNLTRDLEVRYSQSGSAIGKTGIATSRKWRDQSGEQKEEVMFIDLTFFGRTAEIANQYLRKGSKVLIDGRLVLEQWTAQDGTKRSKHAVTVSEMKMLDSKGDNPGGGNYGAPAQGGGYSQPAPAYEQPTSAPAAPQAQPTPTPSVPEIDIDEDEIPF
jgi:single-strand DNA-binding protein